MMNRLRLITPAAMAALAVYLIFGACGNSKPTNIRPAAVSGQFYPSDPQKLKLAVEDFLQDADEIPMEKPIALVVPHAGYIYAGQICADAYRQVSGRSYDVVVILGVNHTTADFRGASVGDYEAFRTPLGDVPVDEKATSDLMAESRDCSRSRLVHIAEHSIEVQLPFIQTLFPKTPIVPVIIHPPDYKMCVRFGQALAKVLKGRQPLIVMSSDLSHYPNQEDAVKADRLTLETFARLDPAQIPTLMENLSIPGLETRACGEAAILAGMTAAKALGATRAVVAGYANSGDALVGDSARTVGYGALILTSGSSPSDVKALHRPASSVEVAPLRDSEKRILLKFARETILRYLTTRTVPLARNLPARTDCRQGVFVTLKEGEQLRGCIGHIPPDSRLGKMVGAMALQAAFNDPRFAPVELSELKNLEIEISVLTPMKPVADPDEIVIGRDGVLMSKSGVSAVFLPQVAVENNWNRNETLDNLCKKAGLPVKCWKSGARFQVFQAEVFSERQIR